MLRNIPNKVDQAMLKRIIDESSWGKYDFMYLRIDFANDCKWGFISHHCSSFISIQILTAKTKRRLCVHQLCGCEFSSSLVTHFSLTNVELQPLDIIDVSTHKFEFIRKGFYANIATQVCQCPRKSALVCSFFYAVFFLSILIYSNFYIGTASKVIR